MSILFSVWQKPILLYFVNAFFLLICWLPNRFFQFAFCMIFERNNQATSSRWNNQQKSLHIISAINFFSSQMVNGYITNGLSTENCTHHRHRTSADRKSSTKRSEQTPHGYEQLNSVCLQIYWYSKWTKNCSTQQESEQKAANDEIINGFLFSQRCFGVYSTVTWYQYEQHREGTTQRKINKIK